MDPLTHAASGAVAMLALPARPATRWAAPLAAAACAAPDLDLLFCRGPLEFLLLHRGISHSLAGAPFFALLLALCCWPLWRAGTPKRWSFGRVWLFCVGMILLHIWLDVVTTYGTMIFLPFSHYRVRLNGLFIVDMLATLPLLAALVWRSRKLVLLALAWTFVYPSLCVGLNMWQERLCAMRFAEERRDVAELKVMPDVFSPFFWRVIFSEKDAGGWKVKSQSLNALGEPRAPADVHNAAPGALVERLRRQSADCGVYFDFAVLPVMDRLPERFAPEAGAPETAPAGSSGPGALRLMFHDLRFGSGLGWMRRLLAMRPNADLPFLLLAEVGGASPDGADGTDGVDGGLDGGVDWAGARLERLRLRFADSGRDSGWHSPRPAAEASWPRWLAGLGGPGLTRGH